MWPLFLATLGLAHAATYPVHSHSSSPYQAAWTRTKCGSPHDLAVQPDLITQWGAGVSPASPPLCEYPRMQMQRPLSTYTCLNGLWEFSLAEEGEAPPFGQQLNQTILVPFPLESCLSGAFQWPLYSKWMFYRLLFDAPGGQADNVRLHFGAVDWNSTIYLNGALLGGHTGGYDGFNFLLPTLQATNNELLVAVYDPSDTGVQPHGKQRISAIKGPGGDTYTPSSGIWQTVWLEALAPYHITSLQLRGEAGGAIHLTAATHPSVPGSLTVAVSLAGVPVATATGATFEELVIPIPAPALWSPTSPTLYDLTITATEPSTAHSDSVGSYTGLRTVGLGSFAIPPTPPTGPRPGMDNSGGDMPVPKQPSILPAADPDLCWALCNATAGCAAWSYGSNASGCDGGAQPRCWLKASVEGWSENACRTAGDMGTPGGTALRPTINGQFVFLNGWLDQSWWSDGEYTAPTDEALKFDLQAVGSLGMNSVRLHQKVNSDRWYYWADTLGVVVLQDAVQKYGGASAGTVEPFLADLKAMMDGRGNHPCIIQWEIFNEGDCWSVFNVSEVIAWAQAYDPHRLIDTDSGGGANDLHIGDVNDIHSYPWPGNPQPSATQYAMQGEYGGIGAFTPGREWSPGQCFAYLANPDAQAEAEVFVNMTKVLVQSKAKGVSVSVFTQITDVENECDGFFNMDRSPKFNAAQTALVKAANQALINA